MTNKELVETTTLWLTAKGFTETKDNEISVNDHIYKYPFQDFDLHFGLFKNPKNRGIYFFSIEFKLKNIPNGFGGVTNTSIPNFLRGEFSTCYRVGNPYNIFRKKRIHGYNSEEWKKGDYIKCLEKAYEMYVIPYFELGNEMLKGLLKKRGGYAYIHNDAVAIIRKM